MTAKVIFACVHNVGRSQTAAAFFNELADPVKARAVSAGTEPGERVHPEVLAVMKEVGIDLSSVKPTRLTRELASGATLLVTMAHRMLERLLVPATIDEGGAKDPAVVSIALRPRAILVGQLAVIAFLVIASVAGQISKHFLGHPHVLGLVPLLDLDGEANLPTAYSFASLLACSLVLLAIGRRERDRACRWLALLFALVALDELVSIHETVGTELVSRALGGRPEGIFHFAWVVPGMALVAVLAFTVLPFLARLPGRIRALVVVSGILYVGGALGFELVGGAWFSHHAKDFTYALVTTVEELLEMLGVALFLNALLRYLCTSLECSEVEVVLRFGSRGR